MTILLTLSPPGALLKVAPFVAPSYCGCVTARVHKGEPVSLKAGLRGLGGLPHIPLQCSSESRAVGAAFNFKRITNPQVEANQLPLAGSHSHYPVGSSSGSLVCELNFYTIINPLLKCADPQRLNALSRFPTGSTKMQVSQAGHVKSGQP